MKQRRIDERLAVRTGQGNKLMGIFPSEFGTDLPFYEAWYVCVYPGGRQ